MRQREYKKYKSVISIKTGLKAFYLELLISILNNLLCLFVLSFFFAFS